MDRLGGPPPIRIVGKETKRTDKNGVETVSIKLNSGTKHTAPKFVGGSAKEAVRHIRSFWATEVKLEYRKDWQLCHKVRTAHKALLAGLNQNDADYLTRKDEIQTKIDECRATMKSLCSDL